MANSDGTIVLSTQVDTSGLSGFKKDTGRSVEKLKLKFETLNSKIKITQDELIRCKKQLEQLEHGEIIIDTPSITKAREKLQKLQQQIEQYDAEQFRILERQDQLASEAYYDERSDQMIIVGADKAEFDALSVKFDELDVKLKNLRAEATSASEQMAKIVDEQKQANASNLSTKIEDLERKLRGLQIDAEETSDAIDNLSGGASIFDKMGNAVKGVSKKISKMTARVLVFQTLYKVLGYIKDVVGDIIMSDEEFKEDWEELKAAFYTAAYPIVNLIIPALKYIVQLVTQWSVSIGKIAASLQGMSYSELVDQAKASKETADNYEDVEASAKNTAKQLASFDDIEILSSGNSDTSASDTSAFEGLKDYDTNAEKAKLEDLMTAIGGALAAVGLILLFKGQITWGLGFIIAGAAIWTITKIASGTFSEDPIINTLTKIMGIAGTLLAAVGLILLLFGQIPWGLGFIVGGAALLGASIGINSDAVVEAMQGPLGAVTAIVSGALLVLGVILVCCGIIPLGIGLIIAGATGFVTVTAINKDAIVDWIKGVWGAIKNFWNKYVAPIFTANFWKNLGKKALNGLITAFELALNVITGGFRTLANTAIGLVNKIGDALGIDWDIPTIPKISLPRLANGAVIPPNKEFLAVLGDQKQGTNIETPLQTMIDAFNIALRSNNYSNNNSGKTELVLEIDGRAFGKIVYDLNNKESRRVGTKVVNV